MPIIGLPWTYLGPSPSGTSSDAPYHISKLVSHRLHVYCIN